MTTVEARIRGEVQPIVYVCHDCGRESACWPGEGIPRNWRRLLELVFCPRCWNRRRRAR